MTRRVTPAASAMARSPDTESVRRPNQPSAASDPARAVDWLNACPGYNVTFIPGWREGAVGNREGADAKSPQRGSKTQVCFAESVPHGRQSPSPSGTAE